MLLAGSKFNTAWPGNESALGNVYGLWQGSSHAAKAGSFVVIVCPIILIVCPFILIVCPFILLVSPFIVLSVVMLCLFMLILGPFMVLSVQLYSFYVHLYSL